MSSVFAPSVNRYFKFAQIGDAVEGRITDIGEQRQSYKYDPRPNAPRQHDFYESGKPKMEIPVTLQTELRDPEDADDDGRRKLIIPVFFKDQSILAAIRDAVRQAGAQDLDVGGWLGVAFVGYDPESQNPQNPRKLYNAMYRPPAPGGGAFSQGQDQAPAAQPQQQQPAQLSTQQWQQQPQQPAPQQPAPQQQPQWQQPQAPAQQQQPRTAQDYMQAAANGPQAPQQPAPQQQWQQPQAAPQQPAQAQAAAPQQTWQQPQAAPQQPQQVNVDADSVRALAAQGFSDEDIAAATGASPEAIRTIRGLG